MKRRFLFDTAATENGGGQQPEPERKPWIGEASAEQIATWKTQHKLGIYQVVTEEGHIVYFKNPDRKEVNCALSKSSQPLARLEELYGLTKIGGSAEVDKNDTMLLGVYNTIQHKLDGSMAVLVNL